MLTASQIIDKYISFFKKRQHARIANAPLVPENDPSTLFTSSGMQPLVPYLLGEKHPQGKRLVNVQNCFRAVDIDEIGDNRHTTFFRMLGNWSLGDYFKKEQLPWFFEFITHELSIDPKRLYVTVFNGYKNIPKDTESVQIWKELFAKAGVNSDGKIFYYGADENWWSRSGEPENMPEGEPGGPDSEVFFDFYPNEPFTEDLKIYSHNGRLLEIGNSVFMEYKKSQNDFSELSHKNVDFGGGIERLLAAVEDNQDMFKTSLLFPIIESLEKTTSKAYEVNAKQMRIIADHFVSASFIILAQVKPSNTEQGYVLRRLIRRAHDNFQMLGGEKIELVLEKIAEQYQETDPLTVERFEEVKNTILEETQKYTNTLSTARKFIHKKYKVGDDLKGAYEISADDAFTVYTTHGLSPTQIKSLGFEFNQQEFAEKMKQHQDISRKGASQKFAGGLADHQEKTIMGHTATHLLHKALRNVLGNSVYQTGSNINTKRVRFDFSYQDKLTDQQIKEIEKIVNEKIKENLPVKYKILPLKEAKEIGAIGLFDEKYESKVKVYFIGDYSIEFCGGPHVSSTDEIKSFKIIKQENIGNKQRRLYAVVS